MNSTISDEICRKLADDIIAGAIGPGQKLEEKAVAEQFNVSRTPVRDAFRQLAGTGLIETRAHRGATVIDLNIDQLHDMFEALGEIEALCAKLSAQRMSAVERKQLEKLHQSSAAALEENDDAEYSDINDRFHRAIHQGSQNETLSNLAAELWQRLAPFRRSVFFKRLDRMSNSSHEHDDIVKLIVAGDADGAFAAMNNHVANSSLNAISYLAESRAGTEL